jgi:hypothetical protein
MSSLRSFVCEDYEHESAVALFNRKSGQSAASQLLSVHRDDRGGGGDGQGEGGNTYAASRAGAHFTLLVQKYKYLTLGTKISKPAELVASLTRTHTQMWP